MTAIGSSTQAVETATQMMIIFSYAFNCNLSPLVQFLQIVDFFSKLVFINVRITPFAHRILSSMWEAMGIRLIPTPFLGLNYGQQNDMWVFKHKLTLNRLPPFLLQDVGNEIFLIILVYLLSITL